MAIYKNVEPLGTVRWTATKHHEYDEGFADGVNFVIEKLDALSEEDVAPREAGKWLLPSENKMNKSWDGLGVVCSKCKLCAQSARCSPTAISTFARTAARICSVLKNTA